MILSKRNDSLFRPIEKRDVILFFLFHQMNRTQFFTFITNDSDTNARILLLKLFNIFQGDRKLDPLKVQFFLKLLIISHTFRVGGYRVESSQDGPHKALVIFILHVDHYFLVLQVGVEFQVGRTM